MKKIKKGSILIFTLIVMSMILVTALTLSTTTIIERKASSITRSSAAAIQGADAGLEYILREFRNYNGETYDVFIDSLSLNPPVGVPSSDIYCDDGTYEGSGAFIIKYSSPEQTIRITAQRKVIGPPPAEIVTHVNIACDDAEALHNVDSFKSVGEDKIAKRALRIDMGHPIERGLVAFWDFEDYAAKRFIEDLEYSATYSAKDKSTNGNTAYLCHDKKNSSTGCKNGMNIMHPGGPDDSDYNEHVSWYGTELDDDGDPVALNDNGNGIAKSHIDDSEHWAMEFSIKNNDGHTEDDGPNEYLYVEDHDSLDFGKSDLSISFWVRPTKNTSSGYMKLIQKGEIGATPHYGIMRNSSDKLAIYFSDNNNNKNEITMGAVEITTGNWQHIVVTFDRDEEVTAYKNGALLDTSTAILSSQGELNSDKRLTIGRNNNKDINENYFVGQMDDIRIYNRVLDQEAVSALCKLGDGGAPSCS